MAAAKKVDVAEPSAVTAAGKRIADVPLSTWKEYLTFRFLSDHADNLPKAFDDARFGFYGRTLNDVPEQRARWKRGMEMLDSSVGEAVGQLYVAQYWPAHRRAWRRNSSTDMREAYREKISARRGWTPSPAPRRWRSSAPSIRASAIPVKWIDYSTLQISRTDPLANEIATEDFLGSSN